MLTLRHYGVPGMRWGRRRGETPSANDNPDHSSVTSLRKKSLNEMSNDELRVITSRLQLLKQYKDISKEERSAGQKFVSDILVDAAKKTLSAQVSKYMGKGLEAIIAALSKKP